MNSSSLSITSNVFCANFTFDKEIQGFDFFRVDGISSERDRFSLLGEAVRAVQYPEKRTFAHYTPSPNENFIVGYLPNGPSTSYYKTENLRISYQGKGNLPPTISARRTLTALLNRSKYRELSNVLWAMGRHSFYPKVGEDLNETYRRCDLILFRGPFFRYNVLGNNKIILSLDSSTHYVSSNPFLYELRDNSLEWFLNEIRVEEKKARARRRAFRGVHFFYELEKRDVAIDDVDSRPISRIPLSKTIVEGGKECRTVAELLKTRYSRRIKGFKLDESQPGLKSGEYTYAPQFLYRNMSLNDVPNRILNDQTYYMDRGPFSQRDHQRPAKVRWELIHDYFYKYNFQYADSGPLQLKMEGPLGFSITTHFRTPMLIPGHRRPVEPRNIYNALRDGFFKSPRIENVYIYSTIDWKTTNSFYKEVVSFASERYSVRMPEKPVPLEKNLVTMRNQLESSISIDKAKRSVFIGILPEGSDLHDELTNNCGELGIPSKFVTIPVVQDVCLEGKHYLLRDTLASLFSRAGGIPWILSDKLHYDCYVAVDVGRTLSEYWALGIVYDRDGKFSIKQGKMMIGEDLDEGSIRYSIGEAKRFSPLSESLIYLRDGEVFESERNVFNKVLKDFPSYSNAAMVSIKGAVPYRIFRRLGNEIAKPLSGDYYFLDEFYAVLCAAGGDEYRHGTPKPVVVEVIPVKGDINITQVVEDCFRLSYLNWGSPGRSYSVPAPVRLAHKYASELSRGVIRFGGPY